MSEPASSTAASIGIYKLAGALGFGLPFAAIIAMAMATPRSRKEWIAALTATVACSLLGGSVLVMWLSLDKWLQSGLLGIAGVGGIMFAAGLPGWLIVRAIFNWASKNKDKDILEVVKDVKDAVKK